MIAGGWVSRTVTSKSQRAAFPAPSVAEQEPFVRPRLNADPDAGAQEGVRVPSQTSDAVAAMVAAAWPCPVDSRTAGATRDRRPLGVTHGDGLRAERRVPRAVGRRAVDGRGADRKRSARDRSAARDRRLQITPVGGRGLEGGDRSPIARALEDYRRRAGQLRRNAVADRDRGMAGRLVAARVGGAAGDVVRSQRERSTHGIAGQARRGIAQVGGRRQARADKLGAAETGAFEEPGSGTLHGGGDAVDTSTTVLHVPWFPLSSVAWHATGFVPDGSSRTDIPRCRRRHSCRDTLPGRRQASAARCTPPRGRCT